MRSWGSGKSLGGLLETSLGTSARGQGIRKAPRQQYKRQRPTTARAGCIGLVSKACRKIRRSPPADPNPTEGTIIWDEFGEKIQAVRAGDVPVKE